MNGKWSALRVQRSAILCVLLVSVVNSASAATFYADNGLGDNGFDGLSRVITNGHGLNRDKLRWVRRREGRYLLRTNLNGSDPAQLWELYMRLVQVEEAFRTLNGDLALRPIHHQLEHRIEAHIFVAFLAYTLHVTLRHRLKGLAPGLTSRAFREKLRAIPMVDVHLPTTDGREIVLPRYTQPDPEVAWLLDRLAPTLPAQPSSRLNVQKELIPHQSL